MTEPAISARGLSRVYGSGDRAVHALEEVDLDIAQGSFVALRGRSGSGKTTLLNCLGGLDRPTGGEVVVGGRTLSGAPESELLELRRDTVAYIFQAFGLVPVLTAAENVSIPLRMRKMSAAERERRVSEALERVGLAGHARQVPAQLSGGQQQRVAIARALVSTPRILLADEPTGQLDSQTGREILAVIRTLARESGMTVLVATHDPSLIETAERVVELRDGRLISDSAATAAN